MLNKVATPRFGTLMAHQLPNDAHPNTSLQIQHPDSSLKPIVDIFASHGRPEYNPSAPPYTNQSFVFNIKPDMPAIDCHGPEGSNTVSLPALPADSRQRIYNFIQNLSIGTHTGADLSLADQWKQKYFMIIQLLEGALSDRKYFSTHYQEALTENLKLQTENDQLKSKFIHWGWFRNLLSRHWPTINSSNISKN